MKTEDEIRGHRFVRWIERHIMKPSTLNTLTEAYHHQKSHIFFRVIDISSDNRHGIRNLIRGSYAKRIGTRYYVTALGVQLLRQNGIL